MCVHGSWGAYVLGGATRGGVELVGGGGPRTGPSGYRAGSPSPWVRLASYVGPEHHGDPITRRSCADHARRACTRGHTDGRSAGEIGGWHRLEAARSGFRARFCRFEARTEGAAYRLGVALARLRSGLTPAWSSFGRHRRDATKVACSSSFGKRHVGVSASGLCVTAFGIPLTRFWANPLTNSKRVPHGIVARSRPEYFLC